MGDSYLSPPLHSTVIDQNNIRLSCCTWIRKMPMLFIKINGETMYLIHESNNYLNAKNITCSFLSKI
ncbi:hypothetical protein PRUPE_4G037300 [Prunus persica]|uniref:Uncharacterized protein n=1 Tax=Prunus persica TaxID=3760 RepID=M5X382_PRUPE|nr:hypothetical protein PRUPE_4G037300 [Prunus persica]